MALNKSASLKDPRIVEYFNKYVRNFSKWVSDQARKEMSKLPEFVDMRIHELEEDLETWKALKDDAIKLRERQSAELADELKSERVRLEQSAYERERLYTEYQSTMLSYEGIPNSEKKQKNLTFNEFFTRPHVEVFLRQTHADRDSIRDDFLERFNSERRSLQSSSK